MENKTNRWLILFAICVSMFCLGGSYMWSVFQKPLVELYNKPISEVSLVYSLLTVTLALFSIVAGKMMEKFSIRYIIIAGTTFWGGGWLLTGFVDSVTMLYITLSLIGGMGDGIVYSTCVATGIRWFPDRRGFASGLILGVSAAGPVVMAPLGYYILSHYGVLNAFKLIGVAFLVIMLSTCWLIRSPQLGWKPKGWEPPVDAKNSEGSVEKDWKAMLADPLFYLVWIIYVASASSGLMMVGHAAAIAQELTNISGATAATMVSILAVMNFIGRVSWGAISDKMGRYRTLGLLFVITAIDMFVFGQADSFNSFVMVISIVSLCFGGIVAIYPAICADLYGLKNMGMNYGILFTAYAAAAVVGPGLAAWCKQLYGNYSLAFAVAAGLAIGALVLLAMVVWLTNKKNCSPKLVQSVK